ncbi:hypothetical protein PLEOSDRAFT_1035368 [Pleurotus ostreatus PC15]|uniref:Enoyl reductase (ER) domain-containing protein n=1 Tax=Pleurotus ostreatus (strain PC15) TaxID=1137138 RepID=A0A067P7W9_PLEO1|nr:hypothetical protein PLEOSDRAFT_1035368 [Pleurotus ostreatus PC15]
MSPTLTPHLAAVLHGPADIRLEHRTLFRPARGAARIRILATGLCGSDLHYFADARNGDFAVRAPLVLGHEAVGEVEAAGAGAVDAYGRQLQVGTRVAIEPGVPAKSCTHCASGRYNLCKDLRFASSAKTFPHLDGTLQEKMLHPAALLWPLPDSVSPALGALAEPLSVQDILILGAGTIGLAAAALAQCYGARKVVCVDINRRRLEFAKAEGFVDDYYVLARDVPATSASASTSSSTSTLALERGRERAAAALKHFEQPDGFDIVYECTGAEACIQMAVYAATTGGKILLVGMGTRNITLPLSAAALREVDILGSFRYAHTYAEVLRLLGAARWPTAPRRTLPDLTRLITHTFPLADTQKAFEMMRAGVDAAGGMVMKVVIQ